MSLFPSFPRFPVPYIMSLHFHSLPSEPYILIDFIKSLKVYLAPFFQLLDHGCGTAFRLTYDSPTLPIVSSAGR